MIREMTPNLRQTLFFDLTLIRERCALRRANLIFHNVTQARIQKWKGCRGGGKAIPDCANTFSFSSSSFFLPVRSGWLQPRFF